MNIGKSVFNFETETVCSVDSNQKVNQDFEMDGIIYQLDTAHEDDLFPPDTAVKANLQDPSQCRLD